MTFRGTLINVLWSCEDCSLLRRNVLRSVRTFEVLERLSGGVHPPLWRAPLRDGGSNIRRQFTRWFASIIQTFDSTDRLRNIGSTDTIPKNEWCDILIQKFTNRSFALTYPTDHLPMILLVLFSSDRVISSVRRNDDPRFPANLVCPRHSYRHWEPSEVSPKLTDGR